MEERQRADDVRLKIRKCRPTHGVIVLALSRAPFPCKIPPYLTYSLLCSAVRTELIMLLVMFRRLTVFGFNSYLTENTV